jgi:hypothetical protein
MTIYSVHVLSNSDAPNEAADRVHFERQGFAWAAFFFGPFWLIARGLWRALLVWLIGAAVVGAALGQGYISSETARLLVFLSALYLGFAGSNLAAAAYDRGRWRLADVAVGSDRATVERNFFSRWSAADAPPPRRSAPPPPPHTSDVIGLFPEAGRTP